MKRIKVETVMTYDDWCKAHRKTLKKMVKSTALSLLQSFAIIIISVGLPVGMIAHWLLIGY